MTKEKIKKKILEYHWEPWLMRTFGAFVLSIFMGGNSRKTIKKLGFDIEHEAALFENGWYESEEVYEKAAIEIEREVRKGLTVKTVSESCESYRKEKRIEIEKLAADKSKTPLEKFQQAINIISLSPVYIWLAHDFEYYYTAILRKEISKYFSGDIDKIIGDISFPEKKNSHNYFEEEILSGTDAQKIIDEYGWIKARDGFAEPFSPTEIKELRGKIKTEKEKDPPTIEVPEKLKSLVSEMKELIYFRTLRTDVMWELIYRARPITKEVAKFYGLAFEELKNYSVYDLISGNPKPYPEKLTCAYYKDEAAFFTEPILPKNEIKRTDIKGMIAFRGKASGIVKVVKRVEELNKVNQGDILVTHMTTPSFIVAMQKAVAFVTDEGGITCHAAIVAREMQKPCIIGTKVATKVLKDGDLVEVDADKGVVNILKTK